jgi:hypothetical protein
MGTGRGTNEDQFAHGTISPGEPDLLNVGYPGLNLTPLRRMADMRRIHGENRTKAALEKRTANGFI